MKKLVLILIGIFLFSVSEAQVKEKIFRRLEEKLSRKADRTAEDIIKPNEPVKAPKNKKEDNQQTTYDTIPQYPNYPTEEDYKSMPNFPYSMMGTDAVVRPTYTFDYEYHTQVIQEKDTFRVIYYMRVDGSYFGIHHSSDEGEITTISDIDNKSTVVFNQKGSEKNMFKSGLPDMNARSTDDRNWDESEVKIVPNGQRKVIANRNCKGYDIISSDFKGQMFTTTDAPEIQFSDVYQRFNLNKSNWASKGVTGLMMELKGKDPNDPQSKTIHMLCTKLDMTNHKIISSDYNSMN